MVKLKPGVPLDPEKFRQAIKKAGYEVRDFELTLRARVERRGETYQLRPVGLAQGFAVRAVGAAAGLGHLVGKQVRAKGTIVQESPAIELELSEVTPPGG